MRYLSFSAALLASTLFIAAAQAAPFAKIHQIDKAHKVIVISGQIQDKLATGDKVWVKTASGPVQLVVTMPMMSVAKCRIPSNSSQSDFALLEVGLEVFLGDAPGRTEPPSSAVAASALTGEWTEVWGSGTAVLSYSDIYDIDLSSAAPVRLRGAEPSLVRNVRYESGRLSFVQHTSFDVSYSLKPNADGSVLEGTAQTPDGSRPVRWTRSAGRASGLSAIEGRWMEFWAPGQETDVTYHDIYLITVSGGLNVRLEKEEGGLSDIKYENGWLSFTQKTAFDVKYRLKLSADGSKLEGTATTPSKTVPIRWERQ